MKMVGLMLAGWVWMASSPANAFEPARGDLLEIYSCEVYTGGCTASAEATLEGRYALRAWHFTDGAFAGLTVALAQVADDNLAAPTTKPARTVVYLPEAATESQRQELLEWLRTRQPGSVTVRTVPISFKKDGLTVSLAAGKYLQVTTEPLRVCDAGSCGESLWYTPHAATRSFSPALNRQLKVEEPVLALRWIENDRRSAFVGQF